MDIGNVSRRAGFRMALIVAAGGGLTVLAGAPPWQIVRWEFLDASSQIEHPAPHSSIAPSKSALCE